MYFWMHCIFLLDLTRQICHAGLEESILFLTHFVAVVIWEPSHLRILSLVIATEDTLLDHTELSLVLLHIWVLVTGLKNFPGLKRKSCGNLQRLEESSHGYPGMDVIVNSKRRHTDFGNQSVHWTENQSHGYLEMVKANSPLNHSASPCAVEGCLSKGFAGLLSGPSCLQFNKERRTSYT